MESVVGVFCSHRHLFHLYLLSVTSEGNSKPCSAATSESMEGSWWAMAPPSRPLNKMPVWN